ncbi:MAG TPA: hypothetical protein DHV48_14460 [Prolixibacteraceae bacterium]|nr:hypothetical protein [Prolixibacteraceae bacterium]
MSARQICPSIFDTVLIGTAFDKVIADTKVRQNTFKFLNILTLNEFEIKKSFVFLICKTNQKPSKFR